MPRDLLADLTDRNTLYSMPHLSRDSASRPPPDDSSPSPSDSSPAVGQQRFNKMIRIHPFAQLLNHEDLDDCEWLEHTACDPIEAASREKLEYRLHTSGELCSGLFTSAYPTASDPLGAIMQAHKFPSIDSSDPDRKRVLLAQIISTKSSSRLVTDDAMNYPKDWQTRYQLSPSTGHTEDGDTVCIHSLCVHPEFAGRGYGQMLLRSYIQRIRDSGIAKRIALLCRDRLVGFYQKAGFTKVGPSNCQFGGGNWVDMLLEFDPSACYKEQE